MVWTLCSLRYAAGHFYQMATTCHDFSFITHTIFRLAMTEIGLAGTLESRLIDQRCAECPMYTSTAFVDR